jgi:hypothetical protein
MQLEGGRIRSWRDLANAFLKQYQYNMDMAPSRAQLQNMTQNEGESFKVYAQSWRALASLVRPPFLETELVDMFINTLQVAYFKRMIGSVSSNFSDLVRIGEIIEMGIKSGKIQLTASSQNGEWKSSNSFTDEEEEEADDVTSENDKTPPITLAQFPCFPYVATAQHQQYPGYPFQVPMNHVPQQAQQKPKKVFNPVPMPYSQLLPHLIHGGRVKPNALKPMTAPFPSWYDVNANCDYHAGTEGHFTDNCTAFKYKVQELINKKFLYFRDGEPI